MTEENSDFLLQHGISKYDRSKLRRLKELPLKNYDESATSTDKIVDLYKDTVNKETTRRGFKSSEFKT